MITYTVREPGRLAWSELLPSLAEARIHRDDARNDGLPRAVIYARLDEPASHLVLSRPDPAGPTDAERDGVRFGSCSVVYVADHVPILDVGEALADRAYLAGYLDGLSRDLTGYGSVDEIRDGRARWRESALYTVGEHAMAQVCRVASPVGLWWLDLWWTEALFAYEAGCRAGVLAPQEHRTGRPPCP